VDAQPRIVQPCADALYRYASALHPTLVVPLLVLIACGGSTRRVSRRPTEAQLLGSDPLHHQHQVVFASRCNLPHIFSVLSDNATPSDTTLLCSHPKPLLSLSLSLSNQAAHKIYYPFPCFGPLVFVVALSPAGLLLLKGVLIWRLLHYHHHHHHNHHRRQLLLLIF
jgi:hypothetical protein